MSDAIPTCEQKRLERAIERDERELRLAIAELKTAASRKVSPRAWVSEHPWTALTLAAGAGLYLATRR